MMLKSNNKVDEETQQRKRIMLLSDRVGVAFRHRRSIGVDGGVFVWRNQRRCDDQSVMSQYLCALFIIIILCSTWCG